MPMYTVETYREFAPHNEQEWLLTNGLGGFASSTVLGMNIRRYNAVLCAALAPPVGRVVSVSRVGELLILDGDAEHPYELAVNQFRSTIHPRGDQHLERFTLEDIATWEFDVESVRITKELQLVWQKNLTAIRYTIDSGDKDFVLRLSPFFAMRDFHALRRSQGTMFRQSNTDTSVTIGEWDMECTAISDAGQFVLAGDWWYGHVYPIETDRGQDDTEDLFTPGYFEIKGKGQTTVTLWIGMGPTTVGDFDAELKRRQEAVSSRYANKPGNIAKLMRAANDFIVYRKTPQGKDGLTVIAGYPWFADWGRDTMISLPGLFFTTGRLTEARDVLSTFAQYVSEGMIPNRFDDYTNEPSYNTVDASLWFIHAVFEYFRHSRDSKTFEELLLPACKKIVEGYRNGTRYGIKMDPVDGLITQGDIHTQLTWMDAKCNGVAFTPRQGKPVEINALWYHALTLMGEKHAAIQVADSFRRTFWINSWQGLADVVEGDRRDTAIRPNQIFAVSLPNSPLTHEQQAAVVEVVRRELLTPVGLRTLSRDNPGYRSRYTGPQFERDGTYHNGMVWPWPIGAFLEAYLKVNNRSAASIAQAKEWLSPLTDHLMSKGCIGQIAEIFEAEDPHRPVGCPAQAWSVAEVLRLAIELGM